MRLTCTPGLQQRPTTPFVPNKTVLSFELPLFVNPTSPRLFQSPVIIIHNPLALYVQHRVVEPEYGISHARCDRADQTRVTLLDGYARNIVIDNQRIIFQAPLPADIERQLSGAYSPDYGAAVGFKLQQRVRIRNRRDNNISLPSPPPSPTSPRQEADKAKKANADKL